MRVSLAGLGQASAADCGTDPCGVLDYLWVSDACEQYLACAGLPPMTFSGQLGAGAQSITAGAASVVGQGVKGAVSNPYTDITLGLLIVAGIAAFFVIEKL